MSRTDDFIYRELKAQKDAIAAERKKILNLRLSEALERHGQVNAATIAAAAIEVYEMSADLYAVKS